MRPCGTKHCDISSCAPKHLSSSGIKSMVSDNDPQEPELRYVDLKDLRLGPIRRESLSDDQLGILRAIYEVISPYQDMAFETMELNFLRDANPDSELAVWSCIAVTL